MASSDNNEQSEYIASMEDTEAFLGQVEIPLDVYDQDTRTHRLILIWAALSKWTQQFEGFMLPLLLIITFPESFLTVAVYSLFNRLACHFFSGTLGAWFDQQSRTKVVFLTTFLRWLSLALLAFFMSTLINQTSSDPKHPNSFFGSMNGGMVFLCLLISSILGSIAYFSISKSIENEWITALVPGGGLKVKVQRIYVLIETISPFIIALILLQTDQKGTDGKRKSPLGPYLFIACLNTVVLVVESIVLKMVLNRKPRLNDATGKPTIQSAMENPFGLIWSNFSQLKQQFSGLLIVSNGFRVMSILHPQNVILIAFLKWWGVEYLTIAMFVGLGSFFSSFIFGLWLFNGMTNRFGLFSSSRIYFLLQSIALVVGSAIYYDPRDAGKTFFMIFVVVNAAASYGFTEAKDSFLEKITTTTESKKALMVSMDRAMSIVGFTVITVVALFVTDPAKFAILTWLSTGFVLLGFVIFMVWSCIPSNKNAVILS